MRAKRLLKNDQAKAHFRNLVTYCLPIFCFVPYCSMLLRDVYIPYYLHLLVRCWFYEKG